jgi:hypothetical protein
MVVLIWIICEGGFFLRRPECPCNTRRGLALPKRKGRRNLFQRPEILVAHTGHSSQLFADASGRNDQFLTTVAIDVNVSRRARIIKRPIGCGYA